MGDRWRTNDGWAVEVVQMVATPDRHDAQSFRISHHDFWVGYAQSVAELERWVELAALEDALNRLTALGRTSIGSARRAHVFCARRRHRGGNGGIQCR